MPLLPLVDHWWATIIAARCCHANIGENFDAFLQPNIVCQIGDIYAFAHTRLRSAITKRGFLTHRLRSYNLALTFDISWA